MPSYSSYVRQMSVLDDDDITWITVKGNHIPIKKGQSKGDAVKEFFESKKSGSGEKSEIKERVELTDLQGKKYTTTKQELKEAGTSKFGLDPKGIKPAILEPKVDSVKAKNALRNEIKNTFFAEKARLYGYEGPDFIESENNGVLTLGVRDISGKSKIASVVKSLKNFWKFDVETETGEKGYTYFIFKGEKK